MKRKLFGLMIALFGASIYAENLFDTIANVPTEGSIKKVKAQVEVIGADVNVPSKEMESEGYTPLTYAIDDCLSSAGYALKGQLRREVVAYLLEKKANPNKIAISDGTSLDGLNGQLTPLIAAVFTKDAILVKMLLDAGADPTLAIRQCGNIWYDEEKNWTNHNTGSGFISSIFGSKYDTTHNSKITAMDVAIWLRDPTMVALLKVKAPKLSASYNLDTLWYKAFMNDLVGFKALIKAGQVPDDYDVEYMIHYGKKDFLVFLDAADVYKTPSVSLFNPYREVSFSLVDDTPDLATVSAYLDSNISLLQTDLDAFSRGLHDLPVHWELFSMWDFSERIITEFSDQREIEKLFYIAFHKPQLDGFYATSDDKTWLSISGNASIYEVKYVDPAKGEPKTGKISILDVDDRCILCELDAFGRFWISIPADKKEGLIMKPSLESSRGELTFNQWTKEAWAAMKRPVSTNGR